MIQKCSMKTNEGSKSNMRAWVYVRTRSLIEDKEVAVRLFFFFFFRIKDKEIEIPLADIHVIYGTENSYTWQSVNDYIKGGGGIW